MAQPQCFLVIGTPRSGTSAVAGVLYHLGVFMGDRLMRANQYNQRGFFHDIDFDVAMLTGDKELKDLVKSRRSLGKAWGVNTRRTADYLDYFPSPAILWAKRSPDCSKASWLKMTRGDGAEIDRAAARDEAALASLKSKVSILTVNYDTLVNQPQQTVQQIADFVGLPATPEAVAFIDPTLRHYQ